MSERRDVSTTDENARETQIKSNDEQQQLETNIESRLTKLGDRITRRAESPFFALSRERTAVRDASVELAVQQAALLWIVRIAKYSRGVVRARLWLDIERALSDLEKIETRIARPQEENHVMVDSVPFPVHSHPETRP